MVFLNEIGSFLSGVCSSIGGAISGIASSLGRALTGPLGGALGIPGVLSTINTVCNIIKGIAIFLGLGEENEKVEEIGLKAEKAERNLEDFDSYKEYKEYLDEIELTDEELEELNDSEKRAGYTIVGAGIYLQGLNEHYEMSIEPGTIVRLANLGIKNPEDAKIFLDNCKEKGINPDLDGFIEGKLTIKEEDKLIDTLKSSVEEMKEKDSIYNKLDKMLEEL